MIQKQYHRVLIFLILLGLALSGCAAPAIPTAQPASVAEGCESGFRPVEHAMGQSCVPEDPQRVVVLDTGELDSTLAVGVKPVGAVSAFADGELPSYLGERTEGIEIVGTIAEPNLEAILALQPDLILSSKLRHEALYDELSAIAPTVFAEAVGVVWKENLLLNAEALNRRAEAEALLADYEQRLADLQAALGEPRPEISIVRFLADEVRIYLKSSFIGTILEDAGLPRSAAQDIEDFALYVGKEGIQQMDADVMFVTTYGPAEETAYADFTSDPLWQSLNVVQAGQVYEVPDAYWMLGIGILAANMVIDDLFTYLVGEIPAESSTPTASVAAPAAESGDCLAGQQLFSDDLLATEPLCVPTAPQRVIALDEGTMADLIALGITPVSVHDWASRDYTLYLDTSAVESVGTPDGPNFEAMLALKPDLIVGQMRDVEWFGEGGLEKLQAIGPTALSLADSADWQDHFGFIGNLVGQPEQAQSLLDSFETRLAEFRETLGDRAEEFTIAIIRSRADGFNVYANEYFIAELVKEAGLRFPDSIADFDTSNQISIEQIDLLTSDYLFVMVRNEKEGEAFLGALDNPLWQFLPAVQNDQVHQVNWSTWVAGWNIVGAHLVLDDLFYYLTDSEAQMPNPFADLVVDGWNPRVEAVNMGATE